MTAGSSIDMSGWLYEHLDQASPDLLREMVRSFAQALMGAEADAVCGAGYGERSDERTNTRNGYRHREWDTRAGSVDLQVPKLCGQARLACEGTSIGVRSRPLLMTAILTHLVTRAMRTSVNPAH
jgi:hypothetical protein